METVASRITPPDLQNSSRLSRQRESNLELYRIIVMMLIVMHHYVVNSGVIQQVWQNPFESNSVFMTIWGLWGKTGINCFVMITGWFMCTSKITVSKFLKLILEVEFYKLIFKILFVFTGYEAFSLKSIRDIIPVSSVSDGFVGCFVLFFLIIPFLNILIRQLTKQQHAWLVILLIGIYTVLGSSILVPVTFNYITWFSVLFILMAYIRFHGLPRHLSTKHWGLMTMAMIMLSLFSVFTIEYVGVRIGKELPSWFFVSDSNKILALLTALCSFMWFKGMRIRYSKTINTVAASTFAVLLIHANSDAMRRWLWHDTLQNAEIFYMQYYAIHAVVSCIVIFLLCVAIDRLRIIFIERPLFLWIDRRWGNKFSQFEEKMFPDAISRFPCTVKAD